MGQIKHLGVGTNIRAFSKWSFAQKNRFIDLLERPRTGRIVLTRMLLIQTKTENLEIMFYFKVHRFKHPIDIRVNSVNYKTTLKIFIL